MADRTRDGCGYDFLCTVNEVETKVEVKTFTAEGRVVVTPLEWREAQISRGHYRLVGFLDDGQSPERWKAFVKEDPFPVLLDEGEWQLTANVAVRPKSLFALAE